MNELSFQQAIDEVKQRFGIVDIVSRYVSLRRAGRTYKGKCPFHNDNSPSMSVDPERGIFKCFSCGAGGDMLKFLTEYHKSSFTDVLRGLAEEAGIKIRSKQADPARDAEQEQILLLHKIAARFYQDNLQTASGQQALHYLGKTRGLSTQTINKFGLGYSPPGWEGLLLHLREHTDVQELATQKELLLKSGLFKASPKNADRLYDTFRGRVMIPICDLQGEVIAFGGRTLETDAQPKYLNSPESPIYQKGSTLFGMHLAREHTRQAKQILLLEGYFDVIVAHQAGIESAVASLGTALTERQATLLYQSNLAREVVLGFDNDNAGWSALQRSVPVFDRLKVRTPAALKVLELTEKDIDEYLQKHSKDQLLEELANCPEAHDYCLQRLTANKNLQDESTRLHTAEEMLGILQEIQDPLQREIKTETAARLLQVSKSTLMQRLTAMTSTQSRKTTAITNNKAAKNVSCPEAEKTILCLLASTDDTELIGILQACPLSNIDYKLWREQLAELASINEKSEALLQLSEGVLEANLQALEGKTHDDLRLLTQECCEVLEQKTQQLQRKRKLLHS